MSQRTSNDSNVVEQTSEFHSGPLPHPDIIQGYENTYSGAAEIIFKSFQDQTNHRISIEKLVVNASAKKEILGVWFGFIIALVTILGGIYTALQDKVFLGGALTFAGLALLVGAFVAGRTAEKKE